MHRMLTMFVLIDMALPRARTCFFELQLPQYSNRDVLRKKLKDAMYLCDTMSQE